MAETWTRVVVVEEELAPRVNQSSACWALKAWTVDGAEGKPAKFGAVGAGGGDGTNMVNQGMEAEKDSLHQAAESQRCPLENQPFSSFLPCSPQWRCPGFY